MAIATPRRKDHACTPPQQRTLRWIGRYTYESVKVRSARVIKAKRFIQRNSIRNNQYAMRKRRKRREIRTTDLFFSNNCVFIAKQNVVRDLYLHLEYFSFRFKNFKLIISICTQTIFLYEYRFNNIPFSLLQPLFTSYFTNRKDKK